MIETLVAFSPYYVANDPTSAGPIDIYYNEALNEYASITYDVQNGFIIEGLQEWYQNWPPNQELDLDGAEEDAVEVPDAAGPASASVGYNTTRRTAGPAGGAAEGRHPSGLRRERTLPPRRRPRNKDQCTSVGSPSEIERTEAVGKPGPAGRSRNLKALTRAAEHLLGKEHRV